MRHDGEPIPESDRTIDMIISDHYTLAESTENITQTLTVAPDGLVVFNTVIPLNKSSITVHVNNGLKFKFKHFDYFHY